MTVGENIKRIRTQYNLTQEEFGNIADVSSMAVSQWENERAVPRMGAIQKIADYFGIAKGVIIDSFGASHLPPDSIRISSSSTDKIPVLGCIHAGDPAEAIESDYELDVPASLLAHHPRGYILKVDGDCMNRVYPEGCHVVIDPDLEPHTGSIAAVQIDGGEVVMRRLYRGASTLVLSPDSYNETLEDIVYTGDMTEVRLLGTVVWFQASEEME